MVLLRLTLVLILTSPVWAGTVYVDIDAYGQADGSSWTNAYNHLQDALTVAAASSTALEIRVAKGCYTPDTGDGVTRGDRQATFALINNIVIKGGYAGFGAPDPNERNLQTYETILSGDLNDNDQFGFMGNSENSIHVVTANMVDATAVLDGFTITAGNANSVLLERDTHGGGAYIYHGSPTLINCRFITNRAFNGGGLYSVSNPVLIECTFSRNMADNGNNGGMGGGIYNEANINLEGCEFVDNQAAAKGGGMFNGTLSHTTLRDCTFTGNRAAYGGGIFNITFSEVQVTGCKFSRNSCTWIGGGMYNTRTYLTVDNSLFLVNISREGDGGGIFVHHGDVQISNCVFHENWALHSGGGFCSDENLDRAHIIQSIFWENIAETGPQMKVSMSSLKDHQVKICITYCNVQGGRTDIETGVALVKWEHNLNINPEFAQPGYWDRGVWIEGDYHLKSEAGRWDPNSARWVRDNVTSPCIDAGDPNSHWAEELWPHGERINIGAYGGTAQASMSLSDKGHAADFNNSGMIDYADLSQIAEKWLLKQILLNEDLSREGNIDFIDFAVFADSWL